MIDRRSFLKGSMGAATASTLAPGIASAGLLDSVFSSSMGGFTGALAAAKFNDIELEYKTGGVDPFTGKFVVNHYLPVAFIEIVNSPTDSLVMGGDVFTTAADALGIGQMSLSDDGMTTTGNVRIWNFPEIVSQNVLVPLCKYCGDTTAYFTPEQDLSMLISNGANPLCAGASVVQAAMQKLQDALLSASPLSCIPKVYYDSSLDPNWITACHDALVTSSLTASLGMGYESGCGLSGSSIASEIAGKLGLSFGDSINPCINSWGPLYPRQYSVTEVSPVLAAAILAYRALHLAAYYYATFPMKVGLGGKFKLVYPTGAAPAFGIGSSESKAVMSNAPTTDITKNYGFLYLTPVTCEKYISSVAGVCAPLACTGTGLAN